MLVSDQLQSGLAVICDRDLHVYQTEALNTVILNLADGYHIGRRVYLHATMEILRVVAVALNGIYQLLESLLVR